MEWLEFRFLYYKFILLCFKGYIVKLIIVKKVEFKGRRVCKCWMVSLDGDCLNEDFVWEISKWYLYLFLICGFGKLCFWSYCYGDFG